MSYATALPTVDSAGEKALLEEMPALDDLQVGHIRHIENLAHQLDNEWAHMGIRFSFQENFEALRYQLAYMAFALGLTHFNRLPAAPGYFRSSFDRLVQKMLLPDVWYYWRDTSRGGGAANLDAPRSPGWIDPVLKDNIMFSAYVQSMSVMYNFLFDDDKYARPGALTFDFNPVLFRTDTREAFAYDQNSLNDHIYWRMVESGYLGIACEPYCVFQICNQPAILAFRLHDILHGTSRAAEVTEGYMAAWGRFGLTDGDGHFNTYVRTHVNEVMPNVMGPWADGWLGTLLNMWNPEVVRERYENIIDDWVEEYQDGTAFVPPGLPDDPGRDVTAGSALDFGWIAAWASEMGDQARLGRMLKYADTYLNPTWEKGGYFYPRNDTYQDDGGRIVMVSPCLGNALLPYARLNVENGLWNLYNHPWGPEHFAEPLLTEVSANVDVRRASYLPDQRRLVFTLSGRPDRDGDARVRVANVHDAARGPWTLTCNGAVVAAQGGEPPGSAGVQVIPQGNALELVFPAGRRWNDFVLSWGASR